jgi:ubiquinone/menaquinone biosynthesis C-methylase UbiE
VKLPGLGRWSDDPLWGSFYDWTVEHKTVGGALWAVGVQSDLRRLYAAAGEIGRLSEGARVLDVPCGGGVAVRGLHPDQGVGYVAADISQKMLERTAKLAAEHGVADQVTTRIADVEALPFEDQSFDLVVSFTGLHCFPDPARAVVEMARVLKVGGVISGSALLNDTGLRFEPIRRAGRLAGLLGPGCTSDQVHRWLARQAVADVTLHVSGAIAYFRGVKRGPDQ